MLEDLDKQTPKPRDGKERLIGLLSFIAVGVLVWALFVYPTERYHAAVTIEGRTIQNVLGKEVFTGIERRTLSGFNLIMEDTGILERVLKPMLPMNNTESKAARMWDGVASIITVFINNLQLLTYQVLLRINTMGSWLFLFSPFVIAQAYGGFQKWRCKRHVFGIDSKNKYLIARRFTIVSILVTALYLVIPGVNTTITTFLPPVAIFFFGLSLSHTIAAFKKVF